MLCRLSEDSSGYSCQVTIRRARGSLGAEPRSTTVGTRRPPARRGQGAALKEDVLAAATAMIARSGDAGSLTLRAVAREVGVAATSIYLHFESVEALLAEVKARHFEELAQYLTAATDAAAATDATAGADPVARLRARAHAYVVYGAERPGEYVVMFAARLVPEGGVATRVTAAAALFDVLVEGLMAVRRRGRAPMGRAEASMVAFHLWTALHGMVSLRLLRPLMPWPEVRSEVDDLVDRLLALPRAKGPRAVDGGGAE